MTRESFRWRILGEGARQFQPECFCCFEVLAAFCKGRKICAKFGTACRNSHWNIRETGSVSSSDRRHPVPAQLFRHLPSSGSSANAEHSWLEHPTPIAHHPQRFATHDPSPQTMGLAGVFEFAKNSWQEAESRSTLSIAGHPQGARWLPCCYRAACASEASWPRMTAM